MADRELIAAILTAGMLPTLEVPQSRTQRRSGPLSRAEGEAIQHAVDHAFGLYRLVLNGLGVDPLAFEARRGGQPRAAAAAERDAVWREQPASATWGAASSTLADTQKTEMDQPAAPPADAQAHAAVRTGSPPQAMKG
jgi:hypothetical protein